MNYLQQVWFIIFLPGKRDGISGYSRDVTRKDYEDEGWSKKRPIWHEFRLPRAFSTGAAEDVDITGTSKLCGWDATMLSQSLETAQYFAAIQTLPIRHPAWI
jgi:hypothetical protein